MADTFRIKRRAVGGAAGAPASLAAAEIAFNEQDETLYYGKGDSGGVATSVIPIASKAAVLGGGGSPTIGFRATKSVDQTGIANIVNTKVTFPVEVYDQGGYYDPALSRWTPPAGMVHIDAGVYASAFTANMAQYIFVFKNGDFVHGTVITSPFNNDGLQISVDDVANGTDYYEVWVYLNGGGTISVAPGTIYTFFCGHIVGGQKGDTGATGPAGAVTGTLAMPQGRLSLNASQAVMLAGVTNLSSIYYSAYVGDRVPIWDGTQWTMVALAGGLITASLSDTSKSPAAIGASKCNDWYVWLDNGVLRLSHGVDWTNDTARSGTTSHTRRNGILTIDQNITNGPAGHTSATATRSAGTYVGTTRSNASSLFDWQISGAAATGAPLLLSVWNAYNRVDVLARTRDTADHTVSTNAIWTTASTPNTNIRFVAGLAEDVFRAENQNICYAHPAYACFGVAYDSITDPIGVVAYQPPNFGGTDTAKYEAQPAVGSHIVRAIEFSGATSGATFGGTGGIPLGALGAVVSDLSLRFRM